MLDLILKYNNLSSKLFERIFIWCLVYENHVQSTKPSKKNIADVADVSASCVIPLCSFLFYLWKAIVIVYKSKIEEQYCNGQHIRVDWSMSFFPNRYFSCCKTFSFTSCIAWCDMHYFCGYSYFSKTNLNFFACR